MARQPDDVDRRVGARIRMRRNLIDMSQEKLAAGLGVSFQQVQKYEKGINRVGAGRLRSIAAILNTSVSYFFEEEAEPDDSATIAAGDFTALFQSKDCVILAQAFAQIEDMQIRKSILSLVRALSVNHPAAG